eukprot:Hpha_TRINITY_DN29759_c0_g1::TRINITY_DN29759_c0_g1_i1::g.2565::m.2565
MNSMRSFGRKASRRDSRVSISRLEPGSGSFCTSDQRSSPHSRAPISPPALSHQYPNMNDSGQLSNLTPSDARARERIHFFKNPDPEAARLRSRKKPPPRVAVGPPRWAAVLLGRKLPERVARAKAEDEARSPAVSSVRLNRKGEHRGQAWGDVAPREVSLNEFREERLRRRLMRGSFYNLRMGVAGPEGEKISSRQRFRVTLEYSKMRDLESEGSEESDSSDTTRVVLKGLQAEPSRGLLVFAPSEEGEKRFTLDCAALLPSAAKPSDLFGRKVLVRVSAEPPSRSPQLTRQLTLPQSPGMLLTTPPTSPPPLHRGPQGPDISRSPGCSPVGGSGSEVSCSDTEDSDDDRTIAEAEVCFDDPAEDCIRDVPRRAVGRVSVTSLASIQVAVQALSRWKARRASEAGSCSPGGDSASPESQRGPVLLASSRPSASFDVTVPFRSCSFVTESPRMNRPSESFIRVKELPVTDEPVAVIG